MVLACMLQRLHVSYTDCHMWLQDVEKLLPIVYTPTVADACLIWGTLIPRPSGLYISATDAGSVDAVTANWPQQQVTMEASPGMYCVAGATNTEYIVSWPLLLAISSE